MNFPPLLVGWLLLLAVLLIVHLIRQWRARRKRLITISFLVTGNARPFLEACARAQAALDRLIRR